MGLVLTFNYLPFMLLPLVRAFERADRTLVLAALDLGATPWQAFWRVTVGGSFPEDVAKDLGISVNAVYKAKSRILRRLREELHDLIE